MNSKNSGVSEVITAILLITLVVSSMAVVGVFVSSIPGETKEVPELSLQVCRENEENIVLYHDGGDTLRSDEFEVHLLDSEKQIIGEPLPGFDWVIGYNTTISYRPGTEYVQFISKEKGGDRLIAWSSSERFCSACPIYASIDASPKSGIRPLTVQFTSTLDPSITSWKWNFGDGSTSDEQNPSHTYTADGIYNALLTVKNYCGERTLSVKITVGCPQPTAFFTATPASGSPPLSVWFTDSSTYTGTPTWDWNFGDGGSASGEGPHEHTYNAEGTYTAVLTLTDICGSNTYEREIQITDCPLPTASFTASPNPANINQQIYFTDTSSENPTEWNWNFDDGSTSAVKNPVHSYSAKGRYTVTLSVKNACGSSEEPASVDIIVSDDTCTPPTASFTETEGKRDNVVDFTDTSSENPTEWYWDFGDGATSIEQNPSHEYSSSGTYTVTLTVWGCGSSSTTSHQVKTGCWYISGTVYISGGSLSPQDLTIVATDTIGNSFYDIPSSNGNYLIDLTLHDAEWFTVSITNCPGTACESYEVSPLLYTGIQIVPGQGKCSFSNADFTLNQVCTPPEAAFTADPLSGSAPLSVEFTDSSTGTISTYDWDFGDGTTHETGIGPHTHPYETAGTYTASLTLESFCGSSTAYQIIEVIECTPPTAIFTAEPESGYAPLAVTFTSSSTGTISTYDWDFGDGTTHETGAGPHTHTYETAGTYTASLTVESACGSDIATPLDIEVIECVSPTAVFTADPTTGIAPLSVEFTDSSTGTISTYDWDFGDGTPHETDIGPHTHTYETAGTYTASLTVEGPCGSSTAYLEIEVIDCTPGIMGLYYPASDFTGTPVSRVDNRIRFADNAAVRDYREPTDVVNWPKGILGRDDYFSCDYQGILLVPTTGTYIFTLRSDDGSGLWLGSTDVSNPPFLDNWGDHIPQSVVSNPISLTQGPHPIRVRMYEKTGHAVLALSWSGPGFSEEYVDSFCYTCTPVTPSFTFEKMSNPRTRIFYDDFETLPFSGWDTQGIVNGQYTGTPRYGRYSVELRGNGAIERTISTVGYSDIIVSFAMGAYDLDRGEYLSAQWSANNGVDWTTLKRINRGDSEEDKNLHNFSYPLLTSASGNDQFVIRFILNGPQGNDFGYVDNVEVTGIPSSRVYQFTDTSTSSVPITSWDWNFGDGSAHSILQNPSYTYSNNGDYTVTLTATNECGSSASTSRIVEVG